MEQLLAIILAQQEIILRQQATIQQLQSSILEMMVLDELERSMRDVACSTDKSLN